MFINCTNHPYETWGEAQRKAAEQYGEVVELPFPQVDSEWSVDELRRKVDEIAREIEAQGPDAVLAAGEFTLLFMLVDRLLNDGVKVVCTCSKRNTVTVMNADGTTEKTSVFSFEKFRDYAHYRNGE